MMKKANLVMPDRGARPTAAIGSLPAYQDDGAAAAS